MSGSTSYEPHPHITSNGGPSNSAAFIDLTDLESEQPIPSRAIPGEIVEILSDDDAPQDGNVSEDSDDVEFVSETPGNDDIQFVRETPARPHSRSRSSSSHHPTTWPHQGRHVFATMNRLGEHTWEPHRTWGTHFSDHEWRGLRERLHQAMEAFRGTDHSDPNLFIYYDQSDHHRSANAARVSSARSQSRGAAGARTPPRPRTANMLMNRVLSSTRSRTPQRQRTPQRYGVPEPAAAFLPRTRTPSPMPLQRDPLNPFEARPPVTPEVALDDPHRLRHMRELYVERLAHRQYLRDLGLDEHLENEFMREVDQDYERAVSVDLEEERRKERQQQQQEVARAKPLPASRPGHTTVLTPSTVIACPLCRKAFGEKGDDIKLFALTSCNHVVCGDCVEEIFLTKVEIKSPSKASRSAAAKRSKGKAKAMETQVSGAAGSSSSPTEDPIPAPAYRIVKKGSGSCPSCSSRVRRAQVQQLYL
ncbi:hypothetical protein EC968_004631 [Mortierella alpina]|nr:hypothetical protein EC968_004631 [Mortierella alpina]